MPGAGWAGQAARDWRTLDVTAVGKEALRLTQLAAHPVAVEPGRRTAILGRPAVAQLIRTIGYAFDAQATFMGQTPMYNHATHKPKLGERVTDTRLSLTSNPNDPDGGVLPFNGQAYPIIARTWITNGVLQNLAFSVDFAAAVGVTPASDSPDSLRLMGTPTPGATTVEEMIVHCKNGIYVNRISHVEVLDTRSGMLTGVTSGGCFLVRDGKIEKSIKNLRILVSPWFFMNQVEAIGTSERTAFGYAPWAGSWPIAPTIVPPLMVRDFNFSALADSV
jgi:predicted Zn-dependent protease